MKTDDKPTNQAISNRRKFLVGATLGSAGAVAAVVAGGNAAEIVAAVAPVAVAKPKGYHVTAHIQQYYETTRI
jgi:hypothetical protein